MKVAACALALAMAAACGGAGSERAQPVKASEAVVEALNALPDERGTDWTSYSQQIALVDVLSAVEQAATPDLVLRGDYTTNRIMKVRVASNFYEFPGGVGSLQPGAVFSVLTDGWAYSKDRGRLPMRAAHSVRLEADKQYVMAIGRQGDTLFPLTAATVVPVDAGIVTADAAQSNPVVEELNGMATDRVDDYFAAHPAEPLARKFADRDAIPRFQAVQSERAKS